MLTLTAEQERELRKTLKHIMVARELDYEATVDCNGVNACEAGVLANYIDKLFNLNIKEDVDSLSEEDLESEY